jgi:hypothetical protein
VQTLGIIELGSGEKFRNFRAKIEEKVPVLSLAKKIQNAAKPK